MHVTNGIAIQLTQQTEGETNVPLQRRGKEERKRSFTALSNDIVRYSKGKKRSEPSNIGIPVQSDNCEKTEASSLIDFYWVLLRMSSKNIPSWKGFNFLIYPFEDELVHQISYLPAINQSPTQLDTVLELLTQSKAKAEKLQLTEVDVVVDQAIYAKACEVKNTINKITTTTTNIKNNILTEILSFGMLICFIFNF